MFYFKNNHLYWIDLLKENGNSHRQNPLPFKIVYTNIVVVSKSLSVTKKKKKKLVYMILDDKGGLIVCGLHWYSLGYSLVSILFK